MNISSSARAGAIMRQIFHILKGPILTLFL